MEHVINGHAALVRYATELSDDKNRPWYVGIGSGFGAAESQQMCRWMARNGPLSPDHLRPDGKQHDFETIQQEIANLEEWAERRQQARCVKLTMAMQFSCQCLFSALESVYDCD